MTVVLHNKELYDKVQKLERIKIIDKIWNENDHEKCRLLEKEYVERLKRWINYE
jgi:hypothetical protein